MRELKNLYDTFKKSGDLKTLYPEMTGDWETDKDAFKKELQPAAKTFEIDSQEEDGSF